MSVRRYALIAVVALTALGMGLWFSVPTEPPPALTIPGVQTLDEPLPLPAFNLSATDDRPLTNASLRGAWSLVFFGYTHCPDICPTTLSTLKHFTTQWKSAGPGAAPRVIFVSLDPQRDTLPRLREHLQYFKAGFIGATAPLPALRAFTEPFGVVFDYEDPATGEPVPDMENPPANVEYAVNHSASVYILDAEGRLVAYVLPPHAPDQLVATLTALRKHYD